MRTLRKRAIERQRRLRIAKTIEVGDTVEVIGSSYTYGFTNGTIATVDQVRDLKNWAGWVDVRISVYLSEICYRSYRTHRIEDVILIKKGSK